MSADIRTYTGVWINWSKGGVNGATLTISQQSGGLLTAFLALFVSFVGAMFWRTISFLLHQAKTSRLDDTEDELQQERQVIFRNSGNAAAVWALFTIPFRRKQNRLTFFLRCLPYALLALACLLGFGVAGIFSSRINRATGLSSLILGHSCGFWENARDTISYNSKHLADTYEAAEYVRQCYGHDKASASSPCRAYVRPSLPFTTNANATCPFGTEMCKGPAFQMDTGRLDSHFDFGINAPPRDRIQFRRVTTCVPLKKVPVTVINDTRGGRTVLVDAGPAPGVRNNYTFMYISSSNPDLTGYFLSAELHVDLPANITQWNPVRPFNRTDGEVTLMMLNPNNVKYTAPVDDPWFSAHDQVNITAQTVSMTVWMSDYLVNMLGCIDQYQICNARKAGDSGCTSLSSAYKIQQELADNVALLDSDVVKLTTFFRFVWDIRSRTMYSSVAGRGANALNGKIHTQWRLTLYKLTLKVLENSWDRLSGPIPNTQWQREVMIWFQTCLAKEQAWAVEWATGPRNVQSSLVGDKVALNVTPPSAEGQKQCSQQMAPNNGEHQSFSILGLALTLGLGGVIILTGLALDAVVGLFRPKSTKYKREQWDADEVLALHEAAYGGDRA